MATVGVSLAEKEKNYKEAVEVLRGLLKGSACLGRRGEKLGLWCACIGETACFKAALCPTHTHTGEWWIRLSIDLEHMKKEEEALQAAEAALQDPWVKHGDRLDLQVCVLCVSVCLF